MHHQSSAHKKALKAKAGFAVEQEQRQQGMAAFVDRFQQAAALVIALRELRRIGESVDAKTEKQLARTVVHNIGDTTPQRWAPRPMKSPWRALFTVWAFLGLAALCGWIFSH